MEGGAVAFAMRGDVPVVVVSDFTDDLLAPEDRSGGPGRRVIDFADRGERERYVLGHRAWRRAIERHRPRIAWTDEFVRELMASALPVIAARSADVMDDPLPGDPARRRTERHFQAEVVLPALRDAIGAMTLTDEDAGVSSLPARRVGITGFGPSEPGAVDVLILAPRRLPVAIELKWCWKA